MGTNKIRHIKKVLKKNYLNYLQSRRKLLIIPRMNNIFCSNFRSISIVYKT